MLKKDKFFVTGIHCKSCKTLIETEIDVLSGVKNIKVDHQTGETIVEYDGKIISLEKIQKEIKGMNYGIGKKPIIKNNQNDDHISKYELITKKYLLLFALPPVFILSYYLINKLGLMETMSRLNDNEVSIFLIFIIGVLASFHCVGMCGGLIVSYSTNELKIKEKKSSKSLPHLQYNLGRLISYTIIGGILGGFGSFFAINPSFTGFILLFAGTFMVLLGISLFTNFKALDAIKLRTPEFIAKFLYSNKHSQKPKGPFIVGLLTAFMPCGPLQAMQLFALATGSVLNGALAMSVYALGTIPILFGFGHIISMIKQTKIKQMVKISGAIVVVLGIVMVNRGLINFNLGISSFLPKTALSQTEATKSNKEFQTINMDLTYNGYSPNVLYIQAGIPVKWVINVKQMTGCTDAIMIESLGIKRDLVVGENIIEFTPPDNVQEIKFSCWMRMVWGKFVINADGIKTSADIIQTANAKTNDPLPASACSGDGSCGGTCGQSTCGCGSK